jgi:8-oxo-dGTP pyrophosphatase MutT (NUDIX family)
MRCGGNRSVSDKIPAKDKLSMLLELRLQLERRLAQPLPGNAAHALMAHEERRKFFREQVIPEDAKISSVLFLLYVQDDAVHFPLIIRSSDGTVHSGQVGLPGGRYEEQDKALSTTAMRETEEEIGVPQHQIELLGKLTPIYIPPSNFMVHPFIGMLTGTAIFSHDTKEVERIIPFALQDLLNQPLRVEKEVTLTSGRTLITPAFVHHGVTIWGATAMMMNELKAILEK